MPTPFRSPAGAASASGLVDSDAEPGREAQARARASLPPKLDSARLESGGGLNG